MIAPAFGFFMAPLGSSAQQSADIHKLGFLMAMDPRRALAALV